MKYLNLVFVAFIVVSLVSCNGNAKKSTHIEDSESMEVEDEAISDDEDENEYLEAAVEALEKGNKDLAIEKILKAVEHIKSYVGEMDDPVNANEAITALMGLVTKIKSGVKMSADDLEEALLKLELFSDDELDLDDGEIEDEG